MKKVFFIVLILGLYSCIKVFNRPQEAIKGNSSVGIKKGSLSLDCSYAESIDGQSIKDSFSINASFLNNNSIEKVSGFELSTPNKITATGGIYLKEPLPQHTTLEISFYKIESPVGLIVVPDNKFRIPFSIGDSCRYVPQGLSFFMQLSRAAQSAHTVEVACKIKKMDINGVDCVSKNGDS